MQCACVRLTQVDVIARICVLCLPDISCTNQALTTFTFQRFNETFISTPLRESSNLSAASCLPSSPTRPTSVHSTADKRCIQYVIVALHDGTIEGTTRSSHHTLSVQGVAICGFINIQRLFVKLLVYAAHEDSISFLKWPSASGSLQAFYAYRKLNW